MILTPDVFKKYLPLSSISDISKYEVFETKALFRYLPKYLGVELTEDVFNYATVSPAGLSEKIETLIKAMEPVLANLTILESIPQFNLVATGSGFGVVNNQNQAPASMDRVKDLKDACIQSANDGLERMLAFLEQKKDDYPKWNKSCLNEGSLIANATQYDAIIDIDGSRRRFVGLKRHIKLAEDIIFASMLSDEFMTTLKSGNDAKVKPTIQQALAYYAEIQYQTSLDPQSNVSQLMSKHMLLLSKAMSYLKSHLSDYPDFATYAYEAPYDNATDGEESGFFIGGITG